MRSELPPYDALVPEMNGREPPRQNRSDPASTDSRELSKIIPPVSGLS